MGLAAELRCYRMRRVCTPQNQNFFPNDPDRRRASAILVPRMFPTSAWMADRYGTAEEAALRSDAQLSQPRWSSHTFSNWE
jgi:hypothetical protein